MNIHHELQLDPVQMDQKVVRLLPRELAHRYHAVPIASDGYRITVVMSNSNDLNAREGISQALGENTCIVQADPQIVDSLIHELWPDCPLPPLQIMCWFPAGEDAEDFKVYAQNFSDLLRANLLSTKSGQSSIQSIRELYRAATNSFPDLLILQYPNQPLMKRLILDLVEHNLWDRIPSSMLIMTQEIRWPIRELLLVVDGKDNNDAAIQWVIRLASKTNARVTILPQISIPPLMFASLHQKLSPGYLLSSTCPLGRRLREITRQLTDFDIQGSLKIRHEPMDQQVHCEILENQYDLVVIEAKPQNMVQHWVIGDPVNPLLHCVNIPILIAKQKNRK